MNGFRKGFSIIEVLIAMSILCGAMYVLGDVQGKSLLRMLRNRDEIEKFFRLKKRMVDLVGSKAKEIKARKEQDESMGMMVQISLPEQSAKHSLRKFSGDFCKWVTVEGSWTYEPFKRSLTLGAIYFDESILEKSEDDKKS